MNYKHLVAFLGKRQIGLRPSCDWFPLSLDGATFNPKLRESVDKVQFEDNAFYWRNLVRIEDTGGYYTMSKTNKNRTNFHTNRDVFYMPSRQLTVWFKGVDANTQGEYVEKVMRALCDNDIEIINDSSGRLNVV